MTIENVTVGKLYVIDDAFPIGLPSTLAVKNKRLARRRYVGHEEWAVLDADDNEVVLAIGSVVMAISDLSSNGNHFVALANERTVFINRLYVNDL